MNTRNLMDFGLFELSLAAKLLSAFKTNRDKTKKITERISVELNRDSGMVFLVDEDFNVAMMNGINLEDWYICQECHCEGFMEQMEMSKRQCCIVAVRGVGTKFPQKLCN